MTSHNLKILAIDTVTEVCSVALNLHGAVTQRLEIAAGHSRLVLGMAQTLLRQCGLTLDQLDALAVDIGPGSFTGTRIGIGVAQGLAFGAGLKVIPVRSLEALAHAQPNETVLPAIDARMGQIYHGLYRTPDGVLQTIGEPALAEPAQLARPQSRGNCGCRQRLGSIRADVAGSDRRGGVEMAGGTPPGSARGIAGGRGTRPASRRFRRWI